MAINNNNVERRLEGRGALEEKEKLMQLAKDQEDIKYDLETDIIRQLKEKYENDRKPGESFSEYIKRAPIYDLIKLELSNGGKVISITDYLKQKEPIKVKKINLAQGDFNKTVSGLTEEDKNVIRDLLRKSGVLVGD